MPGADPPAGRNPDTIAAIATPPGRGAIGIVRVSGALVPDIARCLLGRLPEPRVATYCPARDATGQLLDEGLALYFPAPHSYTGEYSFEFQGHGGQVVCNRCSQPASMRGPGSRSPVSSRGARFSTGAWTWRKPKRSPT